MSDSDESGVMVEHKDAPPQEKDVDEKTTSAEVSDDPPELTDESESPTPKNADGGTNESTSKTTSPNDTDGGNESTSEATAQVETAWQIVSIGTEEDEYAFTFHEDPWNRVLGQVPPGWKVAVVSVVGAFRTGKSFLLTWFLKYMNALEKSQKEGKSLDDEEVPWYKQFDSVGNEGFEWKAGSERNTTGIWVWNRPFFMKMDSGEDLAVLLVDTQGMFDHQTTMRLTSAIFGLSTLLSSYQVYNVVKQIQEDNLQQLALFCEYARKAMDQADCERKPFQKIDFLVRDWQNFDEDDETIEDMEQNMAKYLSTVLDVTGKDADDLKLTREQIDLCFEEIHCYGFSHPGFEVTKKKYTGDVSKVEHLFMKLLDRYCRRVFSPKTLQPKQIHDRELTSVELGSYIKAYAKSFTSGENFPAAATLLQATAAANNTNAVTLAYASYKDDMDLIAGPRCSNFIQTKELDEDHDRALSRAMKEFKTIANFGSKKDIDASKVKLSEQIESQWLVYQSLNESRNPLAGLETYVIPIAVAAVAYVVGNLLDFTCSARVCRNTAEALHHSYAVVICFLVILAATKMKQIEQMFNKVRAAIEIVMEKPKKD